MSFKDSLMQHGNDFIKGNGVVFDDDEDSDDFHNAIMQHADHDAQIEKLVSGVAVNSASASSSLKEGQRQAFHEEQQRSQRPVQPVSQFGVDPRADVTFIQDTPLIFSERTHDHVRLLQQNNASEARLKSMYHTRFR
jgi:hypothetical protein